MPDDVTIAGRDSEHQAVAEAINRALSGSGRGVVVTGPAGVGKTTLIDDVVSTLDAGVDVVRASAHDLGRYAAPLGPIRRLLGALGESEDLETLASDGVVESVFGAIADRMIERAEARPIVVVLEDLHWADETTVACVRFLADVLRGHIALVLSVRTEGLTDEVAVPLLAALARTRGLSRCTIGPLDAAGVAQMIANLRGSPPSLAELELLLARTGGVPFFVAELARSAGDASSPAIDDLLRAELAALPTGHVGVLGVVAVAGVPVDDATLAAVVGDPELVAMTIRSAVGRGRVVIDGDGVRFRHALLAEAVEASLLPTERSSLHRKFAEVVGERPERHGHAARLARHWSFAGDPRLTMRWARAAADEAAHLAAWPEVLGHLSAALAVWDKVDDAAEIMAASRSSVLVEAATAAAASGEHETATNLAESAIGAAADLDERGASVARASLDLYLAGRMNDASALLDRELPSMLASPPTAGSARVAIHWLAVRMTQGKSRDVLDQADEIFAHLAELPDQEAGQALAEARSYVAVAVGEAGDPGRGVEELRAAIADMAARGQIVAAQRGVMNLVFLAEPLMSAERLLTEVRRGVELDESNTDQSLALRGYECRLLLRMGRWADVEHRLASVTTRLSWRNAVTFGPVVAELALERGEAEPARRWLDQQVAQIADGHPPSEFWTEMIRIRLARHEGRAADALAAALGLLASDNRIGILLYGAEAVVAAARLATELDDQGAIEAVGGRIAELTAVRAELAAGDDLPATSQGALLEFAEAYLHDAASEPSASVQRWQRAVEALDAASLVVAAMRARIALAAALIAAGDRDAATIVVHEVVAAARVCGAVVIEREATELARRARLSSTAEQQGAGSAFGLTDREQEVLALVADGRTNAEIGAELFISAKTASVHVTNLLRKLDVANRREAGRRARSLGLVAGSDE